MSWSLNVHHRVWGGRGSTKTLQFEFLHSKNIFKLFVNCWFIFLRIIAKQQVFWVGVLGFFVVLGFVFNKVPDHDADFLVIPVVKKKNKKFQSVFGAIIRCSLPHWQDKSFFNVRFCERIALRLIFLRHDLLQGWHKQSSKSHLYRGSLQLSFHLTSWQIFVNRRLMYVCDAAFCEWRILLFGLGFFPVL